MAAPIVVPRLVIPENVTLLGLGYRARAGKDTVAAMIREDAGIPVYVFAFADILKRAAMEIFGLGEEDVYGDRKMEIHPYWGVTPREILQRMGTDAMRNHFADNVWIAAIQRKISQAVDELEGRPGIFIITDVRFPNEGDIVREWGGMCVHVHRPSLGPGTHESETAMDGYDWDYTIENDGTLEDLRARVFSFLVTHVAPAA